MAKDLGKIIRKYRTPILMLLIIIGGGLLRFWQLGKIPPGIFGDEADTGYQAFSILTTGRDYFGNLLPTQFQSYGDWRVPIYIYIDTIFVALLGLTELAVRLPAAILGTLAVFSTYFLAKKISRSLAVGLIASFLLAVSPWHIQFSRIGVEAIMLTLIFPVGLLLFWTGLAKNGRRFFVFLSAVLLGLTLYAYNTPRLFLPLIIVSLLIIWRKELLAQKAKLIVFLAALAIMSLPLGLDITRGTGQARFLGISIFSNPNVAETVRLEREKCDLPPFIARLIHNKASVWADTFTKNYLSAISTDFLFGQGDPNPRHSVGDRGELYIFELPFLLIGLLVVLLRAFKDKDKFSFLILFWLALAPIPSALTADGGTHAIRLSLFLPWLQVLSAFGIVFVFARLRPGLIRFLFLIILILVISLSVFLYAHDYFGHYPKISGRWWNFGYQEAFDYVRLNQDRYKTIYVSSSWEPSIVYTLFYDHYSPAMAQKQLTIDGNSLGKFRFLSPDINRIKRGEGDKSTLYILNPAEAKNFDLDLKNNPNVKFIKEIDGPDNSPVFVIFSSPDITPGNI